MKVPDSTETLFGLGTQIFGPANTVEPADDEERDANELTEHSGDLSASSDDDTDDDEHLLVTSLTNTTLETSDWASAPAYDAMYLSTVTEYLSPAPKQKLPLNAQINEDDIEEGRTKNAPWALEGYENSLDVDHAFERFSKRVGYEGEQCLRFVPC